MAVIAGKQVRRVRSAVGVDDAEGVRSADIEDQNAPQLGKLDELDAVRRLELTRDARRLAAGMRLEPVGFAILVERARPRLKRYVRRDRRQHDPRWLPQAFVRRSGALQQHAPGCVAWSGK